MWSWQNVSWPKRETQFSLEIRNTFCQGNTVCCRGRPFFHASFFTDQDVHLWLKDPKSSTKSVRTSVCQECPWVVKIRDEHLMTKWKCLKWFFLKIKIGIRFSISPIVSNRKCKTFKISWLGFRFELWIMNPFCPLRDQGQLDLHQPAKTTSVCCQCYVIKPGWDGMKIYVHP